MYRIYLSNIFARPFPSAEREYCSYFCLSDDIISSQICCKRDGLDANVTSNSCMGLKVQPLFIRRVNSNLLESIHLLCARPFAINDVRFFHFRCNIFDPTVVGVPIFFPSWEFHPSLGPLIPRQCSSMWRYHLERSTRNCSLGLSSVSLNLLHI